MVLRLAAGNQKRGKRWRLGWEAGFTAGWLAEETTG